MKKTTSFLLVILHLGLCSVFVLNQFGVGPAWAAKEEVKKPTTTQVDNGVKKATAMPTTIDKKRKEVKPPLKKSKGISEAEWEKIKAKKVLPYDKGPSAIDVSKYPSEMQEIYKGDFTKRCSKCHTIARSINAPYALPEEWKSYIKKMMRKPGSGIRPMAARKIYKFLVYDSGIRKKDVIEKKLKEIEEEEKDKAKSGE